ncbi:MAG: hypothetical protein C9356_16550 [Oleiphilus sp.]|nr:MAG: hypothetical protein C9356_16550 [Oleiphilus sp.]
MPSAIENLKLLLKQDIRDLEALTSTLSAEKTALKSRDSKAIQQVTQNKSSLVQQIETRAKQKAKLLASCGLGIKPGAVTKTLESYGDEELTGLWKESVQALKQCKDQNTVNGSIISQTLQRTAKLMSIIRGQGTKPDLYGQQGKTQSVSNGQHILGKA